MNPKDREKFLDELEFPYCDEVNKYEKMAKIGQGTFGEVFKARHKKTKKVVALKKVLMENEKEGVRRNQSWCLFHVANVFLLQFPITALREIRILQLLKHENVVNLIEICRTKVTQLNKFKSTFYLVFDFCEHDLAGLLSNANVKFSLGEIKKVMQQLLNGLYFIHSNKVNDNQYFHVKSIKLLTIIYSDFTQRHESCQRSHHKIRDAEACRFWSCTSI